MRVHCDLLHVPKYLSVGKCWLIKATGSKSERSSGSSLGKTLSSAAAILFVSSFWGGEGEKRNKILGFVRRNPFFSYCIIYHHFLLLFRVRVFSNVSVAKCNLCSTVCSTCGTANVIIVLLACCIMRSKNCSCVWRKLIESCCACSIACCGHLSPRAWGMISVLLLS